MLIGIIGGIGLIAWSVVIGINAIIVAAGLIGTVFTVAGGEIITTIGAGSLAVAGAVVAGALLIRKYREPISAFSRLWLRGVKRPLRLSPKSFPRACRCLIPSSRNYAGSDNGSPT